jgi:hypothetical protein
MKSFYLLFRFAIISFLKSIHSSIQNDIPNTKESEIDLFNKIDPDINELSSSDQRKMPYIQGSDLPSTETSLLDCPQTFFENNDQLEQLNNTIINDHINDCTGGQGDIGNNIDEQGDIEGCFALAGECYQDYFSSVGELMRHSCELMGECFVSCGDGVIFLYENISNCLGSCCEGLGGCCESLGDCCEGLGECLGGCCECLGGCLESL